MVNKKCSLFWRYCVGILAPGVNISRSGALCKLTIKLYVRSTCNIYIHYAYIFMKMYTFGRFYYYSDSGRVDLIQIRV